MTPTVKIPTKDVALPEATPYSSVGELGDKIRLIALDSIYWEIVSSVGTWSE